MKKSVLYFYTLICSMCILTTSCSKDDNGKQIEEGGSWEELPNGEIPADNVELNLNGTSTTGTISFKALSAETAQIGLKNVIDGYSDVTVDLAMTEQTDGSYKLNGSKEITTKPVTKADNISAAFLKVTVDGNITKEGVVTANIKAEGPGLYIGTYTGTNLVLKYGDEELNSKTVIFDATDGKNISLLLADVIPGDTTTIISGIQLIDSTFTGTTTATTANIKYTGSLSNKVLTLALDVIMKDPLNIAKNYILGEYITGPASVNGETMANAVLSGALYMNWKSIDKNSGDDYGLPYSYLYKGIGGIILPQLLRSITLDVNGNIGAEYMSKPTVSFDMNSAFAILQGNAPDVDAVKALIPTTGWVSSPKNLAYWFEKENKIYLKLNIPEIVKQSMGNNNGIDISGIMSLILNSDATTIKGLLAKFLKLDLSTISDETIEMLLDWIKNGIPMSAKVENSHTYLYLDQTSFDPIFKIRKITTVDGEEKDSSDLLELWTIMLNAKLIPKEYELAGFLLGSFSGFWSTTEYFAIGLDLQTE